MSLVLTLMQPWRVKYAPKTMDKNEIRPSRYGAWDLFQKQTAISGGILSAEAIEKARMSTGNSVVIPVLNYQDITIGNTRTCVVPSDTETSALVTLTFTTYSFGFTMSPARHFNNDIAYRDLFNQKLEQYLLKLTATLDSAGVAQFEADKNIYFPASLAKYYPQIGNAFQVSATQADDFFNQAESISQEMDYYGNVNVLGTTSLGARINRLQAQGAANATNESFQFDRYRWNMTNRLVSADGIRDTVYIVPDGYIATVNRNAPDNILGSKIADFKEWGEAQMPIVNLKMGTYYTKDCADLSALDGGGARMAQNTRALSEGFMFDTDVCMITAYNSNKAGTFSPIWKTEIANAGL